MSTSPANLAPTRVALVDGEQIAWRRLGPGEGRPLVLLNRFRGTLDHWDPDLLDALATRRPVILFDSLGVGRSTGTAPDDIAGMADFAAAVIEQLAGQPVDVLGWSMGGAVAQRLALDHPGRVRRLVLAATGPGGTPGAPQTPEKVWEVAGRPVNTDEDFLYLFFPDTGPGVAAGRAHLARLDRRHEPFGPPVKPASVMAQLHALGKWGRGLGSAWAQLPSLAIPALVANGAHDVMVHAFHSWAMSQRLPRATLVVYPGAGHGFLFHYAARFAADVHAFLDDEASG